MSAYKRELASLRNQIKGNEHTVHKQDLCPSKPSASTLSMYLVSFLEKEFSSEKTCQHIKQLSLKSPQLQIELTAFHEFHDAVVVPAAQFTCFFFNGHWFANSKMFAKSPQGKCSTFILTIDIDKICSTLKKEHNCKYNFA